MADEKWTRARLIPVSGIGSEKEGSAVGLVDGG
jgi:hypothetical protein